MGVLIWANEVPEWPAEQYARSYLKCCFILAQKDLEIPFQLDVIYD